MRPIYVGATLNYLTPIESYPVAWTDSGTAYTGYATIQAQPIPQLTIVGIPGYLADSRAQVVVVVTAINGSPVPPFPYIFQSLPPSSLASRLTVAGLPIALASITVTLPPPIGLPLTFSLSSPKLMAV